MAGQVDILLPGLFDVPLGELEPRFIYNELPNLNRILRLGTTIGNSDYTIDAIVGRTLGIPLDTGNCLPLAQAWADRDGDMDGRLLLFRPVHLRADLHSAIVLPLPESEFPREDLNIIIKDLSDIFKVECDIESMPGGQYLMCLKTMDAPDLFPHLLSVLGKPVNPYIEQTRSDLDWYRLINEMQMYLHQHALNRERAERGRLAVNSLWFWGGGKPLARCAHDTAWYCDDPMLNRFAQSLDLAPRALSKIEGGIEDKNATVVDLKLLEMLKLGAEVEPAEVLRDIDRKLLGPLLDAVRRNRQRLQLRAGYEYDYIFGPASAWKFWRRPRCLADCSVTGRRSD